MPLKISIMTRMSGLTAGVCSVARAPVYISLSEGVALNLSRQSGLFPIRVDARRRARELRVRSEELDKALAGGFLSAGRGR